MPASTTASLVCRGGSLGSICCGILQLDAGLLATVSGLFLLTITCTCFDLAGSVRVVLGGLCYRSLISLRLPSVFCRPEMVGLRASMTSTKNGAVTSFVSGHLTDRSILCLRFTFPGWSNESGLQRLQVDPGSCPMSG